MDMFVLNFPSFIDGGISCENNGPIEKIKNNVIVIFFMIILFTKIHYFTVATKKI
jgi:hypothetical protein